jgi:hypothetical protein
MRNSAKPLKFDHAIAADIWTKILTIVDLSSAQQTGPAQEAGPSSMLSSTRPKEPRFLRFCFSVVGRIAARHAWNQRMD